MKTRFQIATRRAGSGLDVIARVSRDGESWLDTRLAENVSEDAGKAIAQAAEAGAALCGAVIYRRQKLH